MPTTEGLLQRRLIWLYCAQYTVVEYRFVPNEKKVAPDELFSCKRRIEQNSGVFTSRGESSFLMAQRFARHVGDTH